MYTPELSPCAQTMDLINTLNESLATIKILSGLGPLIDGNPEHFESAIELLSLIHQHTGHADRLVDQLAQRVLPPPRLIGEDRP
jgi:hypothetical protein